MDNKAKLPLNRVVEMTIQFEVAQKSPSLVVA